MAGTCDLSNAGEAYDETARAAADPNAPFRVDWQGDSHAYGMEFNVDSKFGAAAPQDQANRALFRELNFRRALTLALDRDGIAASLASGPFYRAWGGGLLPAGPLFTRESVFYLPYDAGAANALLDQMGLRKGSSDYRQYPEGSPNAGRDIEIRIIARQDMGDEISIARAAVPMFQAIGIRLSMRVLAGTDCNDAWLSGAWDMRMARYDSPQMVPNAFPAALSPLDDNILVQHYKIKTSNDALAFENELNRICQAFAREADAAAQRQFMADYNKVWTENAYNIGVVTCTYGMLLNKYMKGVQPGLPVNAYSWGCQSMFMESLWYEPALQRQLVLGNNLPLSYP
jgi:peptide/nickel transport system substrate-binding protein